MNLPEFPEIPLTPESRLRWADFGKRCMEAGAKLERERCAQICDSLMIPQDAEPYRATITALAAAIRKEPL
jgi:hypothetical protein